MVEFFGEVTPTFLAFIIAGAVQTAKVVAGIVEDNYVKLISLGLNMLVMGGFFVIRENIEAPPTTGWEVAWLYFQAGAYGFAGYLLTSGAYNEVFKPVVNAWQSKAKDSTPYMPE